MSESISLVAAVLDERGAEVAQVTLPEAFGAPVNDYLMFDQVLAQRASKRSGSASTKTRGLIRGGGAKPWRQKGTGRARAGSSRSPIWRGGGTIFGPQPRSYAYRLPRSARRKALASVLAQKLRDGELKVLDGVSFEEPKTKRMLSLLSGLGIEGSALLIIPESDYNVEVSARNIPHVRAMPVAGLNVYDILRFRNLIITKDALSAIEERLGS